MINPSSSPTYLVHEDFQPSDIQYGFFTRKGGVSDGLYDSLNGGFGSADDKALVKQNRKLAASALGFTEDQICYLNQVHSVRVCKVTEPLSTLEPADALVTRTKGVALLILTADCVPVIFADTLNGIIGAAHAGWRGAISGVLAETVEAMCNIGANRNHITAVIGPAIQQQSYQVGADLRENALSYDTEAEIYFSLDTDPNKYRFDLTGFVSLCLKKQEIRHHMIKRDTYSEETLFFSHRRATHKKEPDTGRLMTMIGMPT